MKILWKRTALFLTLIMAFALCFAFAGCGDKDDNAETKPCEKHTWEVISSTATCVSSGTAIYKCKVCGITREVEASANGEHQFVNDKCINCNSPKQPIEIVEISCVRSSTQYVRIQGKAKNVSPLRIRNIKFTYYLVAVENGERVVVGQEYNYLVSTTYMESNSTLEFSVLIKCSYTTEYTQYSVNIQAPTFEQYVFRYTL